LLKAQAVNKAQAEHNYDECVKLLSEIIAKQPRNTDAFNSRGLAYAKFLFTAWTNCSGVILSLWLVCATHVHG
jgi:hypothetical protein